MIKSMVYKNIFIKLFHFRIHENNTNQIKMQPIRDRSNISNFEEIIFYKQQFCKSMFSKVILAIGLYCIIG